ncbi:MAG TPA: DUF4981 domain-containing protein, partial [Actinomycetota bacterium]|nr:DUF4981 domain-containing protein [Actinomycetota bacterium]
GVAVAAGRLEIPPLGPGEAATVAVPPLPDTHRESWLTLRALLATDQPWAEAGHEVAWGQLPVTPTQLDPRPTQLDPRPTHPIPRRVPRWGSVADRELAGARLSTAPAGATRRPRLGYQPSSSRRSSSMPK